MTDDRALTMADLYAQDAWQDDLDRAARIDPRSDRERDYAGTDHALIIEATEFQGRKAMQR